MALAAGSAAAFAGGKAGSAAAASFDTTRTITLQHGSYEGYAWTLLAWEQSGTLCMSVETTSAPADRDAAQSETPSAGACGFTGPLPDYPVPSYYFGNDLGPGDGGVSFGPLPATAVQIKVATRQTLSTYAFPSGVGLPAARYWFQIVPKGWPVAADGTALSTPQPLDAAGRPVAFQAF